MKCTLPHEELTERLSQWTLPNYHRIFALNEWDDTQCSIMCTHKCSFLSHRHASFLYFSFSHSFVSFRFVYATMNLSVWAWVQYVCEAANRRKTFLYPQPNAISKPIFHTLHSTIPNALMRFSFDSLLPCQNPVLRKHEFIRLCTSFIKMCRKLWEKLNSFRIFIIWTSVGQSMVSLLFHLIAKYRK